MSDDLDWRREVPKFIWPGTDLCCVLNHNYRCVSCGHIWCEPCSVKNKGYYHSLRTKCITLIMGDYVKDDEQHKVGN